MYHVRHRATGRTRRELFSKAIRHANTPFTQSPRVKEELLLPSAKNACTVQKTSSSHSSDNSPESEAASVGAHVSSDSVSGTSTALTGGLPHSKLCKRPPPVSLIRTM
jgi:hypothetical protein